MSEDWRRIARQNEVIISLLGRLAFTPEQVEKIVTSNKRDKFKPRYVKGYNALDGKKTLSEVAKIIGVAPATLSPILSQWEDIGIIYEIERTGGTFYKKLFPIEGATIVKRRT
jgi:predicted transcriptional regulator of viral defense system